jgi:hypothetical protein
LIFAGRNFLGKRFLPEPFFKNFLKEKYFCLTWVSRIRLMCGCRHCLPLQKLYGKKNSCLTWVSKIRSMCGCRHCLPLQKLLKGGFFILSVALFYNIFKPLAARRSPYPSSKTLWKEKFLSDLGK